MAKTFDKNGNSLIEQEVTVYDYDLGTGEFNGAFTWFCNIGMGLPAHCTLLEPPKYGYGKAAIFDGKKWALYDDLRGRSAFNIHNGSMVVISTIGPLSDDYTLSEPSSIYDEYINGEWVTNTDKKKEATIQANNNLRNQQVALASQLLEATEIMVSDGSAPDSLIRMRKAWQTYRAKLFLVSMPNPKWPAVPSGNIDDYEDDEGDAVS